MRLLQLEIAEPLPGNVFPEMSLEVGEVEAARRYRAVVSTTLRQLRWLPRARLRIITIPDDAGEAVRFWLLPRLAERWRHVEGVFHTDGWEIDFGGNRLESFETFAEADVCCPMLGSRWVQAALPGLGTTFGRVTGPATGGGRYFSAVPSEPDESLGERLLPQLRIIENHEDWLEALEGPLGPALARAWEEEGDG